MKTAISFGHHALNNSRKFELG